jgi:uncharacterized membrane protein
MTIAAGLYEWLLLLHIVAAMAWVGGAILLGALATLVVRGREPEAVARFVRTLRLIGPRVLAPATVAVIGLGVWMVLRAPPGTSDSRGSSSSSRSSPPPS